jgi:hypothetical protein
LVNPEGPHHFANISELLIALKIFYGGTGKSLFVLNVFIMIIYSIGIRGLSG